MQQVVHDRSAHLRQVENLGVVEADDAGSGQIDDVLRVVEDPAEGPGACPQAQARVDTVIAQVGQAFLQIAQGAQGHRRVQHGLHGALDVLVLAGAVGRFAGQQLDPIDQELQVCRSSGALQRIEAGGLTLGQPHVAATTGAHEQFGTTVLVEKEDGGPGLVFLHL